MVLLSMAKRFNVQRYNTLKYWQTGEKGGLSIVIGKKGECPKLPHYC
jgi:hypothetical protein